MLKYSIEGQELMKQNIQNGIKHVSMNAAQMQLLVIIKNIRIMINANANVKN